ncbi:MAG: hypothetical protein SWY16_26675 [Cyanobacteriota bacterium]|nr:hypothetical protein [Cyanobacteriota bacterium]
MTDLEVSVREDLGDGYVNYVPIVDSLGRTQEALLLSEPALTMIVARSRTKLGKRMNLWIHAEVLPTIRKNGEYRVTAPPPRQLPPTRDAIEYLQQIWRKRRGRNLATGIR